MRHLPRIREMQKERKALMKKIALGMVVASLISTSAWAQEPVAARLKLDGALAGVSFATAAPTQAAAEEESPVSVLVGADFPSSYFFRGYRQESEPSLTVQPFVDVAIAGESVSFNVGVWNSLHTGSLKDGEAGWYETDIYAAVTASNIKATYTAYTYPRFDDATIHELMLSTTFANALAPSVAVAFEFSKASGADKGVYLELGVAPAIPMADDAPVSITIPIKVGLSLKDYYGEDTFGYFSAGVSIGKAISDAFEIHGSATVYGFGETLKFYNNDKAGQFVASVGASYGF
jgi:hypothetical protein